MAKTYKAEEIEIGYHPDGYRINKTNTPLNIYTQWKIADTGEWINPKPVCFNSLPKNGWHKEFFFNWDKSILSRIGV